MTIVSRRATVSVHDTDLAKMNHDELVTTIIELRAIIRSHQYCSDGRHLLPEFKVPKPPFNVPELYETEED